MRGVGLNGDAFLLEHQFGQSTAHTAADGDTGRRTSATTMVADAVFQIIGVVGVGRTEQATQVLIVLRVLVLVSDDESDGTARRFPFKDAAEQFHLVCFLSRGGDMALSRTATVQFLLDERQIDIHTWWHPVDNTSDSLTVTLAEGGQSEDISKCIHSSLFTLHFSLQWQCPQPPSWCPQPSPQSSPQLPP